MIEQNEAWLAERRKGIGGSDAAAVLNEGYGCAHRLYLDKTGVPADYGRTQAEQLVLERGHAFEELIADAWARDTDHKIRRMPTRVSVQYPWMRVNVDRQILNDPRGTGALECKSANENVMRLMRAEGIVDHYVLQLQHTLAVTRYTWGEFAVRDPSSWQYLNVPMERDEKLIAVLVREEAAFWDRVERRDPPAKLPEGDKRCKSCLWRKTCRGEAALVQIAGKEVTETIYEEDESLAETMQQLQRAQAIADETAAVVEQVKDLLKEQLGDRSAVSVPSMGARIHFKPQPGSMTWDGRALEADHPELIEKYKKRNKGSRPLKVVWL